MEFCSGAKSMEELVEEAKIRIESCPKPVLKNITFNGYPNKVGWTDKKLEKIASDIKFTPEIFDSISYKPIINQFFNFYFAGNIKKPAIIQSTIYCAAAIFNVRMENGGYRKIFDEEYMDKLGSKGKYIFSWKESPDCVPLHKLDIGKCRFKRVIETTLRNWDEDKIYVYENQINLVKLTSFLALALCRVVGKTETQLMSVLRSRTFRLAMSDCIEWELDQPFSSPCEECIKKCKHHLSHGNLNFFFAVVVKRWLVAEKAGSEEEEIKFILHEALLESIECHGMGVVKLLLSVMKYTGRTFEELMAVICVVATDCLSFPDWQLLVNFYKEYLADKDPPHSLPWVRLVDNDFFRNCSSKDSPYVAATLTAIIEKREGLGIWKAEWIRRIRASPYFLLVGQKLGYIVREILMPTDPNEKKEERLNKKKTQKEKKDPENENQDAEKENEGAIQKTQDLEIEYQELVKKTLDIAKENEDAELKSQDLEIEYQELLKKTLGIGKKNSETEQKTQDMKAENVAIEQKTHNLEIQYQELLQKTLSSRKKNWKTKQKTQTMAKRKKFQKQIMQQNSQDTEKENEFDLQKPFGKERLKKQKKVGPRNIGLRNENAGYGKRKSEFC